MNKISYLLFALAIVALSGCSVITGIFKAGVAVGIIVVVVVIVFIIWLVSMITRK